MSKNKTLRRLPVPAAIVIGFVLINAGCATSDSEGGSDKVANWVMEETAQIVYIERGFIKEPFKRLNTHKKTTFSIDLSSAADKEDGAAIREYAENSSAKEGVWYIFTAPERPRTLFYAYKRQGSWSVIKINKLTERYVPVWTMKEAAEPKVCSLEDVTPQAGTRIQDQDLKAVIYIAVMLFEGYSLNDIENNWYVFTSPKRPGVTFYCYPHTERKPAIDVTTGEAIDNIVYICSIYRQK